MVTWSERDQENHQAARQNSVLREGPHRGAERRCAEQVRCTPRREGLQAGRRRRQDGRASGRQCGRGAQGLWQSAVSWAWAALHLPWAFTSPAGGAGTAAKVPERERMPVLGVWRGAVCGRGSAPEGWGARRLWWDLPRGGAQGEWVVPSHWGLLSTPPRGQVLRWGDKKPAMRGFADQGGTGGQRPCRGQRWAMTQEGSGPSTRVGSALHKSPVLMTAGPEEVGMREGAATEHSWDTKEGSRESPPWAREDSSRSDDGEGPPSRGVA